MVWPKGRPISEEHRQKLRDGHRWSMERRQRVFMSKVEVSEGCWLWTGKPSDDGYGGAYMLDGTYTTAHRAAYELFVGPIPFGLEIDHLCFVRLCVRPEHLEAVTHELNCERARARVA